MLRISVAIVSLCLGSNALASAPDLFGHGARAQALGGIGVSTPRRHNAVYYNPGALTLAKKPAFSLGYQHSRYQLEINGTDTRTGPSQATMIGMVLPLPLGGPLKQRLALGAAFFIPTASVLVADVPAPGLPRFSVVGNRARTVSLQAALGARLGWGLSVGAGFIALAELDGAIAVAPNSEGRIGSQARDQLVADYAGVFGINWQGPWALAAGVTYREASIADFQLPIEVELGRQFPLPVPQLNIVGTAQFDPESVTAELSGPVGSARLAVGATWKGWSTYPNPIAYTAPPAGFPGQPPAGFEDTVQWRAGLETPVELGPVTVEGRVGYQYAPSPAPEQTGMHNYLDSDRQTLGLGVGVTWDRLHLDLAFQLHLLADRQHQKDPGAFEGTGFSIEENLGAPTIEHSGRLQTIGLELGVEL